MRADLSGVDPLAYNLATRTNVADALARSARQFPTRAAVVERDEVITYAELDATVDALATALVARGAVGGTPVAMLMTTSWKFLAVYFACARAGAVAVPVNVTLAPSDIEWILADAEVRHLVVDDALAPLLASLPVRQRALAVIATGDAPGATLTWAQATAPAPQPVEVLVEDRAAVQCLYTSGTTSRPKGVLTSHLSVVVAALTNALALGHAWGPEPSVLVNALPLFHTTALNTLCLPVLVTGGTVILVAPFDAARVLDEVEARRATHVMLLPLMWQAIVAELDRQPRDVSSVRRAVYAMAPMGTALLDAVDERFANAAVILGSGQTEVVPATVLQWPEHRWSAPTSWGPPVPTVTTTCLDGAGRPTSGEGEIAYRGPHVCLGYWNNPGANADAFAGGWFHSGDVGHLDDAQVVWFTDRLKDIIKTGGENVSSVDVERVVSSLPGVRESSIVGVPDDYWGEMVCAVVVPDGSVDPAELGAAVMAGARAELAGFQVPKRVVVVDSLPKTATGKTRKHELRALLRPPTPGASPGAPE